MKSRKIKPILIKICKEDFGHHISECQKNVTKEVIKNYKKKRSFTTNNTEKVTTMTSKKIEVENFSYNTTTAKNVYIS